MSLPDLTPRQLSSLENCLRVAAERYTEDARTIREAHPDAIGWQRVAMQFDRQAMEANALLELVQEAAYAEAAA